MTTDDASSVRTHIAIGTTRNYIYDEGERKEHHYGSICAKLCNDLGLSLSAAQIHLLRTCRDMAALLILPIVIIPDSRWNFSTRTLVFLECCWRTQRGKKVWTERYPIVFDILRATTLMSTSKTMGLLIFRKSDTSNN